MKEPAWTPGYREGFIEPIAPDQNAMIHPFTKSGPGFEIDKGLLRKYDRRFFKLTQTRLKVKVIREKVLITARELKNRKEGQ